MTTPTVAGVFTYSEWAERMDSTGRTSVLVNLQSQCNGIMEDMMAVQCQFGNSYEFTQVTSLPTIIRRQYNMGVAPTQATVMKQVQTCVEYADTVRIDTSLARLNGNLTELRANEDKLHLEAMSQKIASDLFYSGTAGDPTQFTGFSNIYNTITSSTSAIAANVIGLGGTGGTLASMWLVGWGPTQTHTIFPNGLPAGMIHEDQGTQQTLDTNNNIFWAWTTWLQQNIGLCIHDWRYTVRACNIDVSLFGGGSQANLIGTLAAMVRKPPVMPAGVAPVQTSDDPASVVMARPAIYLNRTVSLALDLQAQNKTNVLLKMDEWDGMPVLTYRSIPIRTVDALTSTETQVT
jgi:hypothetical protein